MNDGILGFVCACACGNLLSLLSQGTMTSRSGQPCLCPVPRTCSKPPSTSGQTWPGGGEGAISDSKTSGKLVLRVTV